MDGQRIFLIDLCFLWYHIGANLIENIHQKAPFVMFCSAGKCLPSLYTPTKGTVGVLAFVKPCRRAGRMLHGNHTGECP